MYRKLHWPYGNCISVRFMHLSPHVQLLPPLFSCFKLRLLPSSIHHLSLGS